MAAAFHFGLAFPRLGELVGFVIGFGRGRHRVRRLTLIGAATSGSSILFWRFFVTHGRGYAHHHFIGYETFPRYGRTYHFTVSAWQLTSCHRDPLYPTENEAPLRHIAARSLQSELLDIEFTLDAPTEVVGIPQMQTG